MYQRQDRVGLSKAGPDGKLKLVSAVDIMQDCSQMWLDSEPGFEACLMDNGWGMIMASRQVDVLKYPAYHETLTVQTGIYKCKGYFGYRNTAIYDQMGEPCFLSWSVGAFIDIATNKLVRLPQTIIDELCYDEALDMEYLPKKIPIPDQGFEHLPAIPLRRSDLDVYNHVNNARYVEIAHEALPEDFEVAQFRVEYKQPALWGADLHPRRLIDEVGHCLIVLGDEAGLPYASVEFTCKGDSPQCTFLHN